MFVFGYLANAWEQRKLLDIQGETYGGGTPSTKNQDFWTGDLPWLQSSDLALDNILEVFPKKRISSAALDSSSAKEIPGNSIAVVTRVGVGKLAVIPFSYATSQDFLSLTNLKTNLHYTAYSLYRLLQKESQLTQGTSIKGITRDCLLNKTISIPTPKEQEKIGKFFCEVDGLITLHQRVQFLG